MALHSRELLLLLVPLLAITTPSSSTSPVGINYGLVANNLPSPDAVIPLLRSIGISKVKLYEPDATVLGSFAGTGVAMVVGLPDESVAKVKDPAQALAWVKANVSSYLPRTKITAVTIGNEVLSGNDTTRIANLLPAMQSVHSALASLGLDKQVAVTTAHSLDVLETSYPPSAGSFRRDLAAYISPILSFHAKTGSPFLINAYPYFAYKGNPKRVALDYVLFQGNQGVVDPASRLRYDNMLYAQIDAVHSAIEGMMGQAGKAVEVRVSETGWPSKGDDDEAGATTENARRYNGNLIRTVAENNGTPMRPGSPLEVYVFALFNENMKPGPTSERNYGLFKPDGSPAYQLGISVNSSTGNNTSSGGAGGSPDISPSAETASSTGFYSSTSSAGKVQFCCGGFSLPVAVMLLLGTADLVYGARLNSGWVLN